MRSAIAAWMAWMGVATVMACHEDGDGGTLRERPTTAADSASADDVAVDVTADAAPDVTLAPDTIDPDDATVAPDSIDPDDASDDADAAEDVLEDATLVGDDVAVDDAAPEVADEVLVEDVAPEVIVPEPVAYPKACADIYAQDLMPTFNFEITPDEWQGVMDDCHAGTRRYRPIVFHYGAEAVPAMIRLKGNWSWSCDKLQFVVSFNETDPQGRFHGLRKLILDAPWYDPTILRERLAMDMLRRHGVPYSCVNSARLEVNGELYGVYANLERIDHEYLERHFADNDGNLYEAGSDLKTNEDIGDRSDIEAYWSAPDVATFATLVDLEHAVRVWAGEAMLPDLDGYWAGVDINWYIYHHPTRGLLYVTSDADISFAENIWPEARTVDPILWEHNGWHREPQYRMVMSDPLWCEAFVKALGEARQAYDVALMQDQIDTWGAQILDAVKADPHRTFGFSEHVDAVASLRDFVAARAEFVDDWLATGGHCPVVWPD